MSDALYVQPEATNTLVIDLKRLPLGRTTSAQAGLTCWRAYVPSYFGGQLTVRHTSSMSLSIERPFGQALVFGTREVTWTVPSGEFGEYFVCALGDAGQVSADFVQTFWSRKAPAESAHALLPYNFFYWPAGRDTTYGKRAIEVLRRYAKAVGRSPAEAATFEHDDHQVAGAGGWEGHCHNAAPASALFEQPRAQVINGHSFDEEEMELLAAEFFGNFGDIGGTPWKLSSRRPAQTPGRWDVLGYIKPGEDHSRANLVNGLKSEFAPREAESAADRVLAAAGGSEAQLRAYLDREFGRSGAEFFQAMQTTVNNDGHPLLSNMRSYYGTSGPEEVWNQMFFYLRAVYVQREHGNDKTDLEVVAEFYSNIDLMPSSGLPGREQNAVVTPGTSGVDCQVYVHSYRLIFTDRGFVDQNSDRNEWRSIKNGNGEELYAPTDLFTLKAPRSSRKKGSPFMLGNPVVGLEFLNHANIHQRYR